MQVETDDVFMLSLTVDDGCNSNGASGLIATSDLPPDLVNTDVSDLVGPKSVTRSDHQLISVSGHKIIQANNAALWNFGLEGDEAVPAVEEEGQQEEIHNSMTQFVEEISHQEGVEETMSIEAMEVDVHVSIKPSPCLRWNCI